jgi:hypothetical protein
VRGSVREIVDRILLEGLKVDETVGAVVVKCSCLLVHHQAGGVLLRLLINLLDGVGRQRELDIIELALCYRRRICSFLLLRLSMK